MNPTETSSKAWAAALAGVAVAFINLISSFITDGQVDPVMVEQFGATLGTVADVVIMGVVSYVMVYFAPKNKPLDE